MNSTFKVVFNKARGALMVVNEVTSSVQAKGTKTVIAAAVATMIAGTAAAASAIPGTPEKAGDTVAIITDTNKVYTDASTADALKDLKKDNVVFKVTADEKKDVRSSLYTQKSEGTFKFDKTMWVIGAGKGTAHANGLWAQGDKAEVVNAGTIYVTATDKANFWSQAAMKANNGGTAKNTGAIVAENGYGMGFGNNSKGNTTGSTIINADGGTIDVYGNGVGMDVGGSANIKNIAENYGTITAHGEGSVGVLLDQASGSFTNAGLIDASAEGATAIYVKSAGEAILGKTSVVKGAVDLRGDASLENYGSLTGDITVQAHTPTYNKDKSQWENEQTTKAAIVLGNGSQTDGNIVVKASQTVEEKGVATSGASTVNEVTISIGETAVLNGNLDLSGDQTTVYGTAVAKKTSVVNGDILAKAGTTTVENALQVKNVEVSKDAHFSVGNSGKFKAEALNVVAGASADVSGSATVTALNITAATKVDNKDVDAGTLGLSGYLKTKGDSLNAGSINTYDGVNSATGRLEVAGGTFTNDGTVFVRDLIIDSGATFKTGIEATKNYVVFTNLTLEKDAVFDIKKLNDKTAEAAKDEKSANDLLTFTEGNLLLKGGVIKVAGEAYNGPFKLLSGASAAINGDYTFTELTNAGVVTVGDDYPAKVTINKLTNTNKLVVDVDGTLTVDQKFLNDTGADTTVNGTLNLTKTAADVTFKSGEATAGNIKAEIANYGTIVFDGVEGEFANFGAAKEFAKKINADGSTGLVKFSGNGVTVKAEEVAKVVKDGAAKYDDVKDLGGIELAELRDVTVTGVNGALAGSFGSVQLASGESLTVTHGLTLNGKAEDGKTVSLVTYEKTVDGKKVTKIGGVTLGEDAALNTTGANAVVGAIALDTGVSGADVSVEAGSLTVAGNANIGDGMLYVGKDAQLTMAKAEGATATDSIGSIEAGELGVEGKLVADEVNVVEGWVTGEATIAKLTGEIQVGTDEDGWNAAGKLSVKEVLEGSVIFADPAWKSDGMLALAETSQVAIGKLDANAMAIAGQGSVIGVGTDDTAKVLKAVEQAGVTTLGKDGVKAVVYAEGSKNETTGQYVSITGKLAATGMTEEQFDELDELDELGEVDSIFTTNAVVVNNGSMLVIDMDTVDVVGNTPIFDGHVYNDGTIYLLNVDLGDKVNMGVTGSGYSKGEHALVRFNGDRLMSWSDGKIRWSDAKLAQYDALETLPLIQDMYEQKAQNGASKSAQFNNWLMSSTNGKSRTEVITAGNDVAAIGATAGMASVTMDALSAFNDTVAQRTSILAPNAEGVTVWADVNGGKYEAKRLFNGAGYSSDIYAGVIGVDTTVACGAKIGAALTVGTGDTDSKNTTAETSMDSDFFGVSVYTAKQFGAANVAVDLGYMQGSNDVDVKAYNLGKFSADSDAFTIGIRGELLTKAGDFNIVPHAGLRWTRVSVDSFEAGYTTDIDNMNVFQLPVGVTVTGEFETSGWTLAPAFDLSFVPAFGDKDADMTLGIGGVNGQKTIGMQVIDSNPVQATLGLDAVNGAWAFGLNYKLGAGTDGRLNNSFNANVRYTF